MFLLLALLTPNVLLRPLILMCLATISWLRDRAWAGWRSSSGSQQKRWKTHGVSVGNDLPSGNLT